MPDIQRVFISSTSEDLAEFRVAARDAVLAMGLQPDLFEYWAVGGNPPLEKCLERVDGADLLVVMVAQRYGWVPEGGDRSITCLEV